MSTIIVPPVPAASTAPSLIDHALHLQPSWLTHIPSDGSGIDPGKPNPTNLTAAGLLPPGQLYLAAGLPGFPGLRYLELAGPALATGEFYIRRPVVPTLSPQLLLQFTCDPDDAATASLHENDLIVWLPNPAPTSAQQAAGQLGLLANLSCQLYGPTGQLMIGSGAAGWANTGLALGSYYSANTLHTLTLATTLDWTSHLFSISAVTIDARTFAIPAPLQRQPMIPTTWPGYGMFLQIQKQLRVAGRSGVWLSRADVTWQ